MTKLIVIVLLAFAGAGLASAQTPAPADAAALRKTCTDAMNADPAFAKSIADTVDKQIDQKTIDAHTKAAEAIAEGDVLDRLAGLIERSLVQYEERGAEARYRLLESARA